MREYIWGDRQSSRATRPPDTPVPAIAMLSQCETKTASLDQPVDVRRCVTTLDASFEYRELLLALGYVLSERVTHDREG